MSDINPSGLPWHQGYSDGWTDAVKWNNADQHYRAEEARIAGVLRRECAEQERKIKKLEEELIKVRRTPSTRKAGK